MSAGEESEAELIRAVYPELKALAGRLLRRERANHTLQRTALVHETFLRLFGRKPASEWSAESFLLMAAHNMRQILTDYGRTRAALKRGKGYVHVPLEELAESSFQKQDHLLALNDALDRLGELDPRAVSVIELKYFAGFTNAETAAILGISDGTVEAIWAHARRWLYRALSGSTGGPTT